MPSIQNAPSPALPVISPRTLRLLLALWLSLAAAPALAQPQPKETAPQDSESDSESEGEEDGPEDPGRAREARAHFRKGMKDFRKRAFREAIRDFRLAADLVPSADLWFNIARAHEELGEYEQAIEYYQRYLRDRVNPPDKKKIEEHIERLRKQAKAKRKAQEQQPDTGTLRIQSDVDDAEVTVGDRSLGRSPIAVPMNLEPGEHELRIEREGYVPFRARADVEPGETTGAYGKLPEKTRYRSVRGQRIWTWVVGGLAVGALGASLGLGIKAKTRENDGALSDARDWALYSDIALGSGLGLAVTSVILWFVEGRAIETEELGAPGAPASAGTGTAGNGGGG